MNAGLKYYLYVSDTKLDMLSAQIPQPLLKRIAVDLSVDFKLFSMSLKQVASDETRFAKLRVVTEYFDKYEPTGSIDEPGAYFRGKLAMRWGPYAAWAGDSNLVFFGGATDRTLVGLGGSKHHVLGVQIGRPGTSSHSITPALIAALHKDLGLAEPVLGMEWSEHWQLEAVRVAIAGLQGPAQDMEFLARRLVRGTVDDGRSILLGTPIYVALADS
jgi:hypothetical protein